MQNSSTTNNEPNAVHQFGLSVAGKISIGFFIVLILHISIAIIGHFGLQKGRSDLAAYDQFGSQMVKFYEIDQKVESLQRNVLLFATTGYEGPEHRAEELVEQLKQLLDEVETTGGVDAGEIDKMRTQLENHQEIFTAVVNDRARRRQIVSQDLQQVEAEIEEAIAAISQNPEHDDISLELKATFQAALLDTLRFINGPDSLHFRNAKAHLGKSQMTLREILKQGNAGPEIQTTLDAMNRYEEALIQMVQATRGYLHLVNVVLAGESVEFRRLAEEIRDRQTLRVDQLADSMARDNYHFQVASNTFSVITIILGLAASWLIGRDVAPPLNAIAETIDGLAQGKDCETIPALGRSDELGRLAAAAQVFKEKAKETERLLRVAENAQSDLNEINQELNHHMALSEQMAQEALAATHAKSEFLANMSHEIRTPMTAILGFAETLSESTQDKVSLDAVETIQRNGEHLLAIINDILDLSKVESGKMDLETLATSPSEVVDQVVSLVKVKADGAGLNLDVDYIGKFPSEIKTDPTRLRQVLINLLGNAIKFTEVGGVKVLVRFLQNDGEPKLQFDIIDSGIGMSDQQAERLFQPFMQADNSVTRKFGGTGLGLTICKRLAEMLGGDLILLETQRNVGSTFRLTISTGDIEGIELVVSQPSKSTQVKKVEANIESADLSGLHILLAEDGPDNQRLLRFVLEKAGAQVDIVGNGLLAVEKAVDAVDQGEPFDCVLMDMQMPVMDGYTAASKLRSTGFEGPVIALTAHAMAGDREKCVANGCVDYLTKPIDRRELTQMIFRYTSVDRKEVGFVSN